MQRGYKINTKLDMNMEYLNIVKKWVFSNQRHVYYASSVYHVVERDLRDVNKERSEPL
jgi:hypothetical protein